jgi:two-component sensor histidine kinase
MPAVLIIGDDVSEYRRMQLSLTESLEEKELLFRELNHRTKNNLFLIQSLISIEQGRAVSQETGEVLDRLYGRIGSVMSLHEQLSVEGAGLSVGLKKYLNDIVGAFRETSLNDAVDIRFSTEIDDLRADAKTSTSIGLVLTEFVTNALKHAFRDSSSGAIAVKMIRTERQVVLEVRDDGDGFDPKSLVQKDDSLGISLVRVLSRDLGGELSFGSEPGKGSWFKLLFTDEALAAFYS